MTSRPHQVGQPLCVGKAGGRSLRGGQSTLTASTGRGRDKLRAGGGSDLWWKIDMKLLDEGC